MPNVFTAKELGNGQLGNAQATIFTATADVATYVKHLSLFNTTNTQQIVQLWLKHSGGTARKWKREVLEQNEQADIIEGGEAYILDSGTVIQASTTTAAVVDWWMDGIEETTS